MDTESLFGKSPKSPGLNAKKIITIGNDLDDKPLTFGLLQEKKQVIKYGNSVQRFKWVSQGAVDMAFISAIDFARLKGGWKVLPNICKSTKHTARRVALFFNKNLTEIESVAIPDHTRTTEIVLKLVLKELHQIETNYVKINGTLSELLKKHDAVLLTGDQAVMETKNNPFFIDLGEEWFDLTGLPLVYGFWIGNELTTVKADFINLHESLEQGQKNISAINDEPFQQKDYFYEYLTQTINYTLGEEEQAGLTELYRLAFFYGYVEYIPEFFFAEF